jgi:hypothetical protein
MIINHGFQIFENSKKLNTRPTWQKPSNLWRSMYFMTFESAIYTSNVNQCLFFWGEILHHGNKKKKKLIIPVRRVQRIFLQKKKGQNCHILRIKNSEVVIFK